MNRQNYFFSKSCLLFIPLLSAYSSLGQLVSKMPGESINQFIMRIKPLGSNLAHPVVETNRFVQNTSSIIALYGFLTDKADSLSYSKIAGHLYVPASKNRYSDTQFGPIEQDGGYPEVLSIFFANANKNKGLELIVLSKYPQHHFDYQGDFYETHIYTLSTKTNQLTYLSSLSEKFWGCDCAYKDGRKNSANYKTAKDVKYGLKKMGY